MARITASFSSASKFVRIASLQIKSENFIVSLASSNALICIGRVGDGTIERRRGLVYEFIAGRAPPLICLNRIC